MTRQEKGRAYGNLGNTLKSHGEYRKAIEYNEKDIRIAVEIGDRAAEGGTYGSLGNAYDSVGVWSSQRCILGPLLVLIFSLMTLIILRAFPRLVSMQ